MPKVETWIRSKDYVRLELKAKKLQLTVYAYVQRLILEDLKK